MSAAPARRMTSGDFVPPALGLATVVLAFVAMEALIQTNVITRFIVPPPSEIIGSFGRVIVE